jgi:hypothetical protein
MFNHDPQGQPPGPGLQLLHTVSDDHSRLACTEILPDEGKDTAACAPARHHPQAHPAPTGPQTDGKIERFHRAQADGRACARTYPTDTARRAALPDWLHTYDSHRGHTALGGRPPAALPSRQVITASRGVSWPGRWSCWLSGRPRVTRTGVGNGPRTRHHPVRPGSHARASGVGDDIGERASGPAGLAGLGVARRRVAVSGSPVKAAGTSGRCGRATPVTAFPAAAAGSLHRREDPGHRDRAPARTPGAGSTH